MAMTTEESLSALEEGLGIHLTVVDRDGIFHTPAGRALLSLDRQSHRKNEVCRIGFCQRCIDHCRYEMTREGEKRKAPFVHTCWKGLSEVVIPLIRRGQHFGSLFAGIWRTGKKSRAAGELPPEFAAIYSRLSPLSGERALALGGILSLLVRGLLDRLDEEAVLVYPEESRQREISLFFRYNGAQGARLTDLARQLNLSPSRTSHLVRELFGTSFSELSLRERMRRAQSLLESTEWPIKEIAGHAGFGDEVHFSKIFKARIGVPPGRYRRQVRAEIHQGRSLDDSVF